VAAATSALADSCVTHDSCFTLGGGLRRGHQPALAQELVRGGPTTCVASAFSMRTKPTTANHHDKSARENERGHISIATSPRVHDPSLQSSFEPDYTAKHPDAADVSAQNADAQGLRLRSQERFSGTVAAVQHVGRPQFGRASSSGSPGARRTSASGRKPPAMVAGLR